MPAALNHLNADVVILGAGGAGLRAAVAAVDAGASVLCLSKVPPERSHTVAAQGGINAALGNRIPDDWRWHAYDTVRGGDWLGDQDVIAAMCEAAPRAILELERLGMPFTRAEDGRIYQRAYGAQHSDFGRGGPAYRACAVADRTGHSLLHTLYSAALKAGVKFLVEWIALELILDESGTCRGVLAWELENGELYAISAHAVILATGGFGQAWQSTTASSICTGDGGGMALRAGLALQDMEFVQFHPTSLYGSGILITEGARGEGGMLTNAGGERFLARYAPHSMELASRDVIARAMMQEIMEGRGCGPKKDHLHLRLEHLGKDVLQSKLPAVCEIAKTFAGIDATSQPVPVLPAVHYTMGGVPTNAKTQVVRANESGDAPVPGLYAVGEAACASVHGANRLGCNALLELVVFGKMAGKEAASFVHGKSRPSPLASSLLAQPLQRLEQLRTTNGATPPAMLRRSMQEIMHRHAGIFRSGALLAQGISALDTLWQRFQQELLVRDRGMMWNNDLLAAYELGNLLTQARVTLALAHMREESRGAHWRADFSARNDSTWLTHSLGKHDANGNITTGTRAVRPGEFTPQAHDY